ncbi:unnamed protein product [Sphagnum jensenii]|uniref:Uncharacterized protein n=2 Tax=Sphagnum jensenii TaxID=128206 RepID=A0ABP0V996_9BRYO
MNLRIAGWKITAQKCSNDTRKPVTTQFIVRSSRKNRINAAAAAAEKNVNNKSTHHDRRQTEKRDGSVRRDTSIEIPRFESTSFEIPFPGVKTHSGSQVLLSNAILCEVPNSSGLIAGGLVQRMTSEHVVTKE